MPSKNSINRPKLTTNVRSKQQKLAKKRAQRERAGHFNPSRSAEGSKSGEIRSVPLELYFNKDSASSGNKITTKSLSKKRAKKIERNLKYADQRKLLTDVQAKLEENDMDMDHNKALVRKQDINITKISKNNMSLVREALWKVIEDTSAQGLVIENGNGTTLGGPFFP